MHAFHAVRVPYFGVHDAPGSAYVGEPRADASVDKRRHFVSSDLQAWLDAAAIQLGVRRRQRTLNGWLR